MTIFELTKDLSKEYQRAIDYVVENVDFQTGYGSSVDTSHKHHAYKGGLQVHTTEVLENALAQAKAFPGINVGALAVAAVWHDFGKIYDYNEDGHKTEHASYIYHVARSFAEWYKYSTSTWVPHRELIGHCILAHHGRKEWGSPVEPQCAEAQILHFADYLSMKYGVGR